MLVDSNEGKEYMDRARALLSSISAAETSSFARVDRERNAILHKVLVQTILANSCLLLLTACVFGLIRYYEQVLEQEVAQSRQELAMRNSKLDKLKYVVLTKSRVKTSAIEQCAHLLMQNY